MSNSKVFRLIGLDRAKPGDIGLELEVEGAAPLPVVNEKSWRSKEDGSLRGHSMEYYSNRPIPVDEAKRERINYLCNMLAKPEFGVDQESPRTSLHVHVNVSNLTATQVWTAVTCYWLLENLLMKYCGPDREGNLFCLRLSDAEAALRSCIQDIKSKQPFATVYSDRIRYMAQNLKAIRQFGSIEYRGMRGTIDPEVIDTWSTQLHNLVHRSSQVFKSPADLLDRYFNGQDIMQSVLDAPFIRTLRTLGDAETLIDENAGLLCELAYSTSWGRYEDKVSKLFSDPFAAVNPAPRRNAWQAAAGDLRQAELARIQQLLQPFARNDIPE